MFGAGASAPVVPVALVWLMRRGGGIENQALRGTANTVKSFLAPSSLYGVAALPFDSTLAPLFNVWGMAACLAFVGWAATSRDATSPPVRDWYVASAIWLGAYSLLLMSLAYFPDRYRIHLLVPLALNVAAGITLFQQAGMAAVTAGLQGMRASRRLVVLGVFGLPTAAFWAPLLASAYALIGGDAAHLRVWIPAVGVALVVTVAVLDRRLRSGHSLLPFIVFPITAALAWLVFDRLHLGGLPFWPTPEHGPWTWTLGGGWWAVAGAWALTVMLMRPPQPRRMPMIPLAAALYAVLSLVRILPSYVAPQYTMRQTSETLGRELAGFQGVVATRRAESLFNANTVRYRNTPNYGVPPDVFVVAFSAPFESKLAREYRLVAEYDLFISPRYVMPTNGAPGVSPSRLPVRLYVRPSARNPDGSLHPVR
jgi:hypothetical protein